MIREIESQHALQIELVSHDRIYFRLTGGFGNQLFGLSEAFSLYKMTKQHVLIDVGSIEHTKNHLPEWLEWSKSQNWFSIIKVPKNISGELKLLNLGERSKPLLQGKRLFTGWEFSLRKVELSGLFIRSIFPFDVQDRTSIPLALHYRAGDYAHADGIGILKHDYYSRALRQFDPSIRVKVFSDDQYAARILISNLGIGHRSEISSEKSAVRVLFGLAKAENLVASNSTLSWWANYFSGAVLSIAPKPFYLQDWKFDSKAKFQETKYLTRFASRKDKIYTRIKWIAHSYL